MIGETRKMAAIRERGENFAARTLSAPQSKAAIMTTERAESILKFAAELATQEAERAAERATEDARSLASAFFTIDEARDISPALATKDQFDGVRRALRHLDNRKRADDLSINEALVSAYLHDAKQWVDAVIEALWKAK
jgi:hypothetical protein